MKKRNFLTLSVLIAPAVSISTIATTELKAPSTSSTTSIARPANIANYYPVKTTPDFAGVLQLLQNPGRLQLTG